MSLIWLRVNACVSPPNNFNRFLIAGILGSSLGIISYLLFPYKPTPITEIPKIIPEAPKIVRYEPGKREQVATFITEHYFIAAAFIAGAVIVIYLACSSDDKPPQNFPAAPPGGPKNPPGNPPPPGGPENPPPPPENPPALQVPPEPKKRYMDYKHLPTKASLIKKEQGPYVGRETKLMGDLMMKHQIPIEDINSTKSKITLTLKDQQNCASSAKILYHSYNKYYKTFMTF